MTPPTQAELDTIPADRRLELMELERQRADAARERRRQSRHQWLNSLGILFGVLFTAGGLVVTALTFQTGREELRTAREGQVTDRYTKAVEQLGSTKPEVRLGGIYALERIFKDSERDRDTVIEVLASYVRVHAQDEPPAGSGDRYPPLAVDVHAALTVLSRNRGSFPVDLRRVDLHGKNLQSLDLSGALLGGADLRRADLSGADLHGAYLRGADLSDASFQAANLKGADLQDTDLHSAYFWGVDFTNANLRRADLRNADLSGAKLKGALLTSATLKGADLFHADLSGAELTLTDLTDADLTSTDLRGARGTTESEIRKVAKADENTQFGPESKD